MGAGFPSRPNIQELMTLHISAPKMEAAFTSETWGTSPTTTELKSILNRRESPKHKEDEMGRAYSMGDKRIAYREIGVKTEGKIPLRRPRHGREENIETDLRVGVIWTGFIWLRTGINGGIL
jgi:hypothetical protein